MPDDTQIFEFDTSDFNQAIARLQQLAQALGVLGGGGLGGMIGMAGQVGGAAGFIGGGGFGQLQKIWQALPAIVRMGAVAGVAAGAITLLGTAAARVANDLLEMSKQRTRLGGGFGGSAFAMGLGGAFGMNGAAMGEALQQWGQSGLGAMMMSRMGVAPTFNLGQEVNRGAIFEQVVRQLSDLVARGDESAAIGFAQMAPGGPELLELARALADPRSAATAREIINLQKSLAGPAALSATRQFNMELKKFQLALQNLAETLGQTFLPIFSFLLKAITLFIQNVPPWGFFTALRKVGAETADAALNANTRATLDNTLELRLQNGMYGGGQRMRTAIPGGFGPGLGFSLNYQMSGWGAKLGAQSVSM